MICCATCWCCASRAARSGIRICGRNWKRWRSACRFPGSGGPVSKVDELVEFIRRNIQKTIALDALIMELRGT